MKSKLIMFLAISFLAGCTSHTKMSDQTCVLGTTVRGCQPEIYFKFNSATIEQESLPALQWVATKLSKRDNLSIVIGGHADMVGGKKVNKDISKERALTVQDYLLSHAVPQERIFVEYWGKEALRSTDPDMQDWERRVELHFRKSEKNWYQKLYEYLIVKE